MPASSSANTPKITKRQRLEARERTILDAAAQIFADHGVDGSRMADIAREADVAEGTLYLYYKNKQDLLAGVVGHFWQELTLGAEAAVNPEGEILQQLEQLARYHLTTILDQYEVVMLTNRARQGGPSAAFDLQQIRDYVRVYDRIIQRGIDRGVLQPDLELWQTRDLFFGTLEFSARTLNLHQQGVDSSVVDNLMSLYQRYVIDERAVTAKTDDQNPVEDRLTRIEQLLETLVNQLA